jgi:hypothetical protein
LNIFCAQKIEKSLRAMFSPPPPLPPTATPSKRTRDSAQLNAFVAQRFVACTYASWPQDQKREWRTALAAKLNGRAAELRTTADWDARRVQNKLSNLRLLASSSSSACATPASSSRRALPPSFSFKPLPPPPTPLAAAAAAANDLCESIDELALNAVSDSDDENDSDAPNRHHTPTLPVSPSRSLSPPPRFSLSPPPPLPSLSPPRRSPSPPPPPRAPSLAAYMRNAQAALAAACTHGASAFCHNGLRGASVERVLCDFLRAHCSSAFVGVSSGEVVSAATDSDEQRRQFDCVLYDTRVPTFAPNIAAADAPRLFFAPGVLCVLEFKTTLSSAELGTALTAARTLAAARTPYAIVALRSQLTLSALRDALIADSDGAPANVLGVFVLGVGCLLRADGRIVRDDERCTLAALVATLIELAQRAIAAPPAQLDVFAFV